MLDKIKEYLQYNEETGKLIWIKSPNTNSIKVGDVAGNIKPNGRTRVQFLGCQRAIDAFKIKKVIHT